MPRSPDPLRPTGAHWGVYESVDVLPNVKGSPAQTSEVTLGDLAVVGGGIVICTSPAEGAAVWAPIVVPVSMVAAPKPPAPEVPAPTARMVGSKRTRKASREGF